MPTPRQIAANQRNALKSTGPKSPEGKARVARNALKHGLAGHGVVFTDEMTVAIEERKRYWYSEYRPDGPAQRWKFERICVESVRADACLHQVIALRDELALRALETWDDDRSFEAEQLASRLADRPELIQPTLLQSKHGVLWLIDRWEGLEEAIGRPGGEPSEEGWSRMLDLLGVPGDARDDARSLLLGEGPDARSPSDLIRDALADLRRRLDAYLVDRDERSRCDAEAGVADDGPAVRRLARYEGKLLGRMRQAEADLRRMQGGSPPPRLNRAPADRPPAAPSPAPPPLPEPAEAPHPGPPRTDRPTSPERPSPTRGVVAAPPGLSGPSLADSFRHRLPDLPAAANRRERRVLEAARRKHRSVRAS